MIFYLFELPDDFLTFHRHILHPPSVIFKRISDQSPTTFFILFLLHSQLEEQYHHQDILDLHFSILLYSKIKLQHNLMASWLTHSGLSWTIYSEVEISLELAYQSFIIVKLSHLRMYRSNTYNLITSHRDNPSLQIYQTAKTRIKSLQKIKVNCKGLPSDFFRPRATS